MWKAPGKPVTAEFDGESLEMRPVAAGDYVDFLEAQESASGSIAQIRCYANLVVKSAYKDGKRFFNDADADELVCFATRSEKNAKALAELTDATAEACGVDVGGARKN